MISIIIPSTGRADILRTCLDSLVSSVGDNMTEIIVVIDDDVDSLAICADLCDTVIHRREKQGALSGWNQGAALASGAYLVLAADDLVFGYGWLDEALRVMDSELGGYGMVGFNDMSPNAKGRGTHWIVSRAYAVDCWGGVLVVPLYDHNYIDWEAQHRAERDGRYAWAENAHVHHNHFDWDKSLFDKTYERSRVNLESDRALFYKRQATGFPNNYPAAFGKVFYES